MGNWRRVHLIGTCAAEDVPKLKAATLFDINSRESAVDNFHPLMSGLGVSGLPQWVRTEIDAVGSLAERDYSAQDVADTLAKLVMVAPSLTLKVHCGEDYEGDKCIATITVALGLIQVGIPEVAEIPQVPITQLGQNLMVWLIRSGQF